MSRFFNAGSSSESESDHSESDEQETLRVPSKFARGAAADDESSEGEPTKRVVRSAKDRRFDELQDTIKQLKNHININDWNAIHNGMPTVCEFDRVSSVHTSFHASRVI